VLFEQIPDYDDQIERSGWLERHSHECPKVTGTTRLGNVFY